MKTIFVRLAGAVAWVLLAALLLAAPPVALAQQPAGTTAVAVPYSQFPNFTAVRGPRTGSRYERVAMLLMANEIRGLMTNQALVSLGFEVDSTDRAAAAATGTLKVWLRNSPDRMYHLNDNWSRLLAQQPNPMQLVYDGPLTVPVAGPCDVRFQTPFAYGGQALYVAYEWTTAAPLRSRRYPHQYVASVGYRYNPWWHGCADSTALPPVLTDSASTRPLLRLGYATPARDAAVVLTQGIGEVALQSCVMPFPVRALVRNRGSQPLLNLPVSVVPGVGMMPGSGHTVVIPALAPGAQTWVRLPLPQPVAAGTYAYFAVQVPPDQNTANDTEADSTTATANALSYVRGLPFDLDLNALNKTGAGTTRGGTLLTRFPLRQPTLVSEVRLFVSNDSYSPGETIYGVVLDENGRLLGRSPDHVITSADGNAWLACPLPQPVRASGRAFFAGMAIMPNRPGPNNRYSYDPLQTQLEATPRDSVYYYDHGDTARLGLRPPRYRAGALGRFMIEVLLQTAPLALRSATAPWAGPDVWPNPAHDRVNIGLPATGPARVWATLCDVTGRVVQAETKVAAPAGTATLPLPGLPPGLYLLQLRSGGWQRTQRLVIE